MRSLATSEPAKSNTTSAISENDEEELLANMNLTTFKERYRRLIPYMTFYVANNYLHAQTALEQNYATDPSINLLRKLSPPEQHPLSRLGGVPRRGNKYRVNLPDQDKKFVPSVQFDPRNIGGDNDYFTPVKYSAKINYAEYSTPSYQLYRVEKTYPEITTPSTQILQENRYFVTARPLRPPVPAREQHLIKKPLLGSSQDDYDQVTAKIPNVIVSYPNKEYEGLRYIPPPIHPNVQQQSSTSQIYRKPNVINNLVKSFQLTEQLPEILNNDNIDSSIKTLLEIINILHNSRQENLPQPQKPLLSPPRLTNYKPKTHTRPKVITETRFQATPNPLLITEDPERYKVANVDNVRLKTPQLQSDNINHIKDEKVEYYIPYVQDISNESNQQGFRPTPRPDTTEHTYEITEDLSDDVLQDERYTLPISTEASVSQEHVAPNEITHPKPKTSLKYGATRGKPHVDYPTYAIIPETNFSCKSQRYKGFFGDPATRCQVWHYCDLNGGKSSFLCPNGTIFSQIALTCDWWFNVKCETTTQLYVLNERLYKYILPIMPKFPEDFTGPEVDRYLELKFKEMEAKLKEKKLKKQQEDKSKHKTSKSQTSNDEE
ncbi:hypothetical protein EAG_03014 [Camponotus floridanus]|uniref:Chitin-binding type-2 domain-containing protein n=1 Tax=Camponotus floridanus TaxID=104421 RepID=E2ARL0_CAMFO|nr:hypothetical protein EAG_03014 [Camponotus floridanus]